MVVMARMLQVAAVGDLTAHQLSVGVVAVQQVRVKVVMVDPALLYQVELVQMAQVIRDQALCQILSHYLICCLQIMRLALVVEVLLLLVLHHLMVAVVVLVVVVGV
jgi:hypothetical protein